jgi:hypothetical protein
MRKAAIVLVVLGLLALVSAPGAGAAAPSHGWDVRCGHSFNEGAGWWNLRGYNVACRVARKTADRYTFGGDPNPKDWKCSDVQTGDEVFRANCIRDKGAEHQHIRF